MATHEKIRIPFEIEGRRFEAVGFLREGESYVLGDEMLRRTANENGGAIKGEDYAFLYERRAQLPRELDLYWLVTDERHPERPQFVAFFGRRHHGWRWLGPYFFGHSLVVRRCP